MLLAIDCGNSKTAFAIFQSDTILHTFQIDTKKLTIDSVGEVLAPWLQTLPPNFEWAGGALCSVVPALEAPFIDFVETELGAPCLTISSELNLGFSLAIESPEKLGADRLGNVAYAARFLKLPAVVVDIGTATTLDLLSANKEFLGGVILPGPVTGLKAVSQGTAKLPNVDLVLPPSAIGKNTVDCLRSGALYGYSAGIDGLISQFEKEIGQATTVLLTGGLGAIYQPLLRHSNRFLRTTTLEGIRTIFSLNSAA